jgi:hypothetical protein
MLRSSGKCYVRLVYFVVHFYSFASFGILYQEKSGNPGRQNFGILYQEKSGNPGRQHWGFQSKAFFRSKIETCCDILCTASTSFRISLTRISIFGTMSVPQMPFPQTMFPRTRFPQTTFPRTTFPQTMFPQMTFPQTTFPRIYGCNAGPAAGLM